MELEASLLERVRDFESLSRWERSQLGRDLRSTGLSYGEIMELIPVNKSTLATWCRDVRLTEEQVAEIAVRRASSQRGIPRDTQRKRREAVRKLRRIAEDRLPSLVSDPIWLAGTVLYWAEGSKTRNQLRLANTDPNALRLFISWVRGYLDPEASFSIQLHLHHGNDELAAREHWRRELGLRTANFHRTYVKPRGTGHRKNHLPHGVRTVKVRRCGDMWQTAMAWVEALHAHLGLSTSD